MEEKMVKADDAAGAGDAVADSREEGRTTREETKAKPSLMDALDGVKQKRVLTGDEPGPADEKGSSEYSEPGPEEGDRTPREESGEEKEEAKESYRFKSHGEAEKGYRNLQGLVTKTQQELAKLREEMDQIREERESAKKAETEEQAETELEDYVSDRLAQSYEEVEKLDPDDFDDETAYRREVARINFRAQRDIDAKKNEFGGRFSALPEAGEPENMDTADTFTEEGGVEGLHRMIRERTREAGVDAENDPVFKGYASMAPSDMPFEKQLDWAIEETKKYRSRMGSGAAEREQPMSRGGPGRDKSRVQSPGGTAGETSMDRAFQNARERRRLQ